MPEASTSAEIALVTGANRGIGFEVCRQLGQRGMRVFLAARHAREGSAAVAALQAEGLDVRFLRLDVLLPESIQAMAEQLQREADHLDVLVNNAGAITNWTETASTADLNESHVVLETNLFGPWRLIQRLLPLLRWSENARVVNVSSAAGSHGDPLVGLAAPGGLAPSYAVSKAALNALTSKLAAELAPHVRVNAVCPGLTATFAGAEQAGARPVQAGAAGVVWAATLPKDGPTGGFFRDGQPLPW